jgi:hypothetical protein
MANIKISQLPAATSPVAPTSELPVNQGGDTKRAAISQLGFASAGAGAQTRTIQDKLREYLSPEDFGAVGDNATDDSAAMTAAMNAAVSLGLRLRLRDGATYFLASWGTFSNSGILRIECLSASGSAGGATLRGPASTVDFLSPAANFDIQGVTFATWASVVTRSSAQSGSYTYVVFSNNRCFGCTSLAFNIERPIDQYRIENNDIASCTGGYAIRIGDNVFANQDTWVRGWICNNRIVSLSGSGSTSAVAILVYGREVTIANNKIDGVTQSGTGECWGIYTKVRYGQVFGNYINNIVAASNGDNVGINIKGTTRSVTTAPQGFANIVWGNHVRNIGSVGVRGAGIRAQTDDVLMFGNEVEDSGSNGIVADETSAYRNVRIAQNLVRFVSNVTATVGIRLEGAGTGVVAEQNNIRNAATGVRLTTGAGASTMTDGQVVRNFIDGATFGIIIDAFSGCTLDRPVIEGNIVNGGNYGLVNNGSAGTIQNARIRFNDLARANGVAVVLGPFGTTPVIQDNSGYLAASATWDPPDIVNGSSAATTLTVGGAAVGDAVVASFSNALNGLALAAQVSATDTVEVRLLNNSGGAVNLTSGTVRVRVTKGFA